MKRKEQIEFGKYLRRVRREKDITQEKLGELSGVHRNYISSIERGERNINLVNILRIAKGLNIHPARLFDYLD